MASARRLSIALLACLIGGCQSAPGPTPTGAVAMVEPTTPADAESPGKAPEATPAASDDRPVRALGGQPAALPTTSAGKIQAAVAAGAIDVATGYLYRAYASVGDPQLPAEYAGDPGEDTELSLELGSELTALPADIRTKLLPYVVRPSDARSYWKGVPEATAAGPLGAGLMRPDTTSAPLAGVACVDGWMHDRVSTSVPVMLWTRCAFDVAAATGRLEEARTDMIQLYPDETKLMGLPIGDKNNLLDGYPDPPEGDDGLIDIYLVADATSDRNLNVGTLLGVAHAVPPFTGPKGGERSSGYIVIRPSLTGPDLKSTLAHEFFHVLQFSHNAMGMMDCPISQLAKGCNSHARANHWFTEASAVWAEHDFVPEARNARSGPYARWVGFRQTTNGLSLANQQNEYDSWEWPLFMQQESKPDAIANTWRALEGKVGWWEFQRTLDAQLSFAQRFDDFAVEVFNKALLPGDPVKPRFRSPTLSPAFPETTPGDPRYSEALMDDLSLELQAPSTTYNYTLTLNSLASSYFHFSPPPDSHTLRFEFAALAPEIEIDAIVQVGDTWERRELPAGTTEWCLDTPKDAVEDGYLIFSDHDQTPGAITRPWSITAEEAGCGSSIGTLTYSYLDTAPLASQPGGSSSVDASVQVHLKINDPDSGINAEFVNDGSTYGLTTFAKAVLYPGVDGCSPTSTSTGSPGGALELDSVVGDTWVDDDGKNRLTLAIDLPVHEEGEDFLCSLGTSHSSGDSTVQFPSCDGTQAAETPTSRLYVFDCKFRGASIAWTLTGTVTVQR